MCRSIGGGGHGFLRGTGQSGARERMTQDVADDLPDVHLADVKQPLEPVKGMSIWARMRLSYRDMREATRTLIEEDPSEPRLLFFVLMSDVIFFLSFGVRLVVSPSAAVEGMLPLPAMLGVGLVGILLIRTMLMYLFAAMVKVAGWPLGGRATFKEMRAAVFWGSLVAAPVGVFGALVGAVFANLELTYPIFANPFIAWPPLLIGVIAFIYFLAAGVTEAHGFRETKPVFGLFSLLAILIVVGVVWAASEIRLGEALEKMREDQQQSALPPAPPLPG